MAGRARVLLLGALWLCACAGNKKVGLSPELAALQGRCDVAYSESHHFRFDDKGRLLQRSRKTTVLLSEASTRAHRRLYVGERYYAPVQQVVATLDGEPLASDRVTVIKPDIKDVFIDDFRAHVASFPPLSRGQTVAIEALRRYVDPAFVMPMRVRNADRLQRFEVVVEHGDDVKVDFDVHFVRERAPLRIERLAGRTRLVIGPAARARRLAYFPFNSMHALVWPRLTRGGRVLNPGRAGSYARWYRRKIVSPARAGGELAALLARTRKQAKSPRARVKALYDYVRREVRYVADEKNFGGIVPRPASKVLARRWGDCKDKAFFVREAARHLGIDVDLVLIGTEPRPLFDPGASGSDARVYLGMFNHMIASFKDGQRRIYFDPTSTYSPFGTLPEGDIEGVALLLDERPRRVIVPPPPDEKPTLELRVEGDLARPERARATVVFRNAFLRGALHASEKSSKKQLDELLSRMGGARLEGVVLSDFQRLPSKGAEVRFRAGADFSALLVRSRGRIYLPKVPFAVYDSRLLERAEDKHIVVMPWRPHYQLTFVLKTRAQPIGGEGLTIDSPEARFSTSLWRADEKVTVKYALRQRRKRLRGAARKRFLEFARRYLDERRNMYAFARAKASRKAKP